MSKYSDYLKSRSEKNLEYYLGQKPKYVSNKYIKFNHVLDEDNILLATGNIKFLRYCDDTKIILMVGNNKAIYVNPWQIRETRAEGGTIAGYLVKLNRKYFKVYTFKNDFEGMAFDGEQNFDSLKAIAKTQNETPYHVFSEMKTIMNIESCEDCGH